MATSSITANFYTDWGARLRYNVSDLGVDMANVVEAW